MFYVLIVRLCNEFLHGPVWVLGEDGISMPEGSLPLVESDPEIMELDVRIGDMFTGYYHFDSHDCACWFDKRCQLEGAGEMLDLALCLYARVCELNDGSFRVEDELVPELERLLEESKRLPRIPSEMKSRLDIDPYFPVQARFDIPAGKRRSARFVAPDDVFVEFWIQDATDFPESLHLSCGGAGYERVAGCMPKADAVDDPVCLGFKGDVSCKEIALTLFDDGASVRFSEDEPVEWRRAGDALFGYDGDVNLLEVRLCDIPKPDMQTIERYLKELS